MQAILNAEDASKKTKWTDALKKLKSQQRIVPFALNDDKPKLTHSPDLIFEKSNDELEEDETDEETDDESLMEEYNFFDRPLPPLPKETSSIKRTATSIKIASSVGLKRATTWLGLATQKLVNSPKSSLLILDKSIDNDKIPSISSQIKINDVLEHPDLKKVSDTTIENTDTTKSASGQAKHKMYCRVMQIINSSSTRDCEYELEIQLNHKLISTRRGVLRKIDKYTSADRPHEDALIFDVEKPFSLDFIVSGRYSVMRDKFTSIWPRSTTLTKLGQTSLVFDSMNQHQGVSRFRLQSNKPTFELDLLVDLSVVELKQEEVSSSGLDKKSSLSSTREEVLPSDPDTIARSKKFCQLGDYLTLYSRGLAHPVWKRYWVTMKDNRLNLYDFTFKDNKEPLYTIGLGSLIAVARPSFDDCENVGIARKTGLVLQYKTSTATKDRVQFDPEFQGFENKMLIYADAEQSAKHWHISFLDSISNLTDQIEEPIDLRFLW